LPRPPVVEAWQIEETFGFCPHSESVAHEGRADGGGCESGEELMAEFLALLADLQEGLQRLVATAGGSGSSGLSQAAVLYRRMEDIFMQAHSLRGAASIESASSLLKSILNELDQMRMREQAEAAKKAAQEAYVSAMDEID